MDAALDAIDGTIHALFNCAGVPGPPFFSDVDTMLVNFAAPQHLARVLAPRMTDGGAICTISSAAGAGWLMHIEQWKPLAAAESFADAKAWVEAHPDEISGGYAPSKEAVIVWTQYAALDLGPGVRINCISPGTTQTPMMDQFVDIPGADDFTEVFTGASGRRSAPSEQAWPMIFLNSDAASYVSGTNLATDAGTVGMLTTGRRTMDFGATAQG
jgi:NAD(P)-dependent dehydrogenase (short-subunit alcohol dehydrogenase family)